MTKRFPAQRCYGDQVNRFGEEDEDLKKACINKLNRVTKKLNESEKGKPVDMDDTMNGESLIDLDEGCGLCWSDIGRRISRRSSSKGT